MKPIAVMRLRSKPLAPSGQIVITTTGTSYWTVPAGVSSISMVAVGAGGRNTSGSSVTVGGTMVCRALNGSRIGDGGGDGGTSYVGGGGAGGYSGNGGDGGNYSNGGNGSGGGGGGGSSYGAGNQSPGGGVGLLGEGTSGAGAVYTVAPYSGQPGSGGTASTDGNNPGFAQLGGNYGSLIGGGIVSGIKAGALSYKNGVSVSPGDSITIAIEAPYVTSDGTSGAGAVRIMWGAGRSYPSTNTADV